MIEIIQELKKNKKVVVRGFGTFSVVPRRKGAVHGIFGDKKVFKNRVKFKPSLALKNQICK